MDNTYFKILTLNVRGINDKTKRLSIFQWLKRKNVDICFMQESYSSPEIEQLWTREWGGSIEFNHGDTHSRGVAILFRSGLEYQLLKQWKDDCGRIIGVDIMLGNTKFSFINIYAPSKENSQTHFYNYLKNQLRIHFDESSTYFLGGDFNYINDHTLDRKGCNLIVTKQYKHIGTCIEDILAEYHLKDIWGTKNLNKKSYTWSTRDKSIQSRLDYMFTSEHAFDSICKSNILPQIFSDHSPVLLSYKDISSTRESLGLWQLNNCFLKEPEYIDLINTNVTNWVEEATTLDDTRMQWDYIKYKIRNASVLYGGKREKERHKKDKYLESELTKLHIEAAAADNLNQLELANKINEYKTALNILLQEKASGLILQSKIKDYEEGEKSNSYFLNLVALNKVKKTMTKLMKSDNTFTTDMKEIALEQAKFFSHSYKTKSQKILKK